MYKPQETNSHHKKKEEYCGMYFSLMIIWKKFKEQQRHTFKQTMPLECVPKLEKDGIKLGTVNGMKSIIVFYENGISLQLQKKLYYK